MQYAPSRKKSWLIFIDPGRLQLTTRRSYKGVSATSQRLGGVGAVEISCDHRWREEIAQHGLNFGCKYGVTLIVIGADILLRYSRTRTMRIKFGSAIISLQVSLKVTISSTPVVNPSSIGEYLSYPHLAKVV